MLGNAISVLRVSFVEVLDGSLADVSGNVAHMVSNAPYGMVSHHIAEDLSVKGTRLAEVTVGMIGFMPGNQTGHLVGLVLCLRVEGESVGTLVETIGFVVGKSSYDRV